MKNKLHALQYAYQADKKAVQRLKARINLLDKQIKEVEKEIEMLMKEDDYLKMQVDNVCIVKGLVISTLATVLAETNGFETITSMSQLCSYVGYDVIQRQSGSSVRGKTRISKKGNKHIRKALYFPAISVVKHEKVFADLYERVLERTGIKMKAYVAVQRKLLMLIYTLVKKQEAYDPKYYQKVQAELKAEQHIKSKQTNPKTTKVAASA